MLQESFSSFFKKQILLERSNITYVPPQNKRLKMYDFYVLTYIKGVAQDPDLYSARGRVMRFPEELKVSAEEAANSIVESLAKDFIRDVLFSICSEMRHCSAKPENLANVKFAELNKEGEEGTTKVWPINYLNWEQSKTDPNTIDVKTRSGSVIRGVKTFRPFQSDRDIQQVELIRQAYKGVGGRDVPLNEKQFKTILERIDPNFDGKTFTTRPIRNFVEISSKLLLDQNVFFGKKDRSQNDSSYAGRPWSDICMGWLRLDDARNMQEKTVAVDHIYDLQHNNGSVFTKLREYEIEGDFEWLKKALDEKRDIKDYYELITKTEGQSKISSDARTISLKVLHLVRGSTEEGFTNKRKQEAAKELERQTKETAEKIKAKLSAGRGNIDFRFGKLQGKLPDNLVVNGDLLLDENPQLVSLPRGLVVKGKLSLYKCGVSTIPPDIQVGGDLTLISCPIKELPHNLKVGGSLELFHNKLITALPEGLIVGDILDVRGCTSLTTVPTNIKAKIIKMSESTPFIQNKLKQVTGDTRESMAIIKKQLKKEYPGVGEFRADY